MNKSLAELKHLIAEAEKPKKTLILEKLPYSKDDLAPVMSKEIIELHYGKLAKGYVDRYNKKEGDSDFNEAGAFLHNLFFPQFKPPSNSKPYGASLEFINKNYKDFESFKKSVEKTAMTIQGSGWVYLSKNGKIKTIVNHQIQQDIVLLIDWWEHAFQLDYGADKEKYLKNFWRIINWEVINQRFDNNYKR
jgi:Fe-Mn family superoxide dismutase